MQGDEFYATWVANKAIYRTRMAMADDGEEVYYISTPSAGLWSTKEKIADRG